MKYYALKAYGIDSKILNDVKYLKTLLEHTALMIKANILHSYFHKFKPQGISGIVVISGSHLSLHSFPECNILQAEIVTCSDTMPVDFGIDYLIMSLKPEKYETFMKML